MLTCPSEPPRIGFVPATVGHVAYHVLPPEHRVSVTRAGYVGIPLYDGELGPLVPSNGVLRYVGTAHLKRPACIRTATGTAASDRVALFRVVGRSGEGVMVQVRVGRPELHERCTSCRTVHFFVQVQ